MLGVLSEVFVNVALLRVVLVELLHVIPHSFAPDMFVEVSLDRLSELLGLACMARVDRLLGLLRRYSIETVTLHACPAELECPPKAVIGVAHRYHVGVVVVVLCVKCCI